MHASSTNAREVRTVHGGTNSITAPTARRSSHPSSCAPISTTWSFPKPMTTLPRSSSRSKFSEQSLHTVRDTYGGSNSPADDRHRLFRQTSQPDGRHSWQPLIRSSHSTRQFINRTAPVRSKDHARRSNCPLLAQLESQPGRFASSTSLMRLLRSVFVRRISSIGTSSDKIQNQLFVTRELKYWQPRTGCTRWRGCWIV